MAIRNAIASLAVNNLRDTAPWYQRLFGRPADSKPMPTVAEWKFDRGGWLQVYELEERAGKGSVTLAIDDFDAQLASLRKLGIDAGQPIISDQFKVVMIKDPDGNSIAFAQTIDKNAAH